MSAFTAVIVLGAGFTIGFGAMWVYCRFFRDRKQSSR